MPPAAWPRGTPAAMKHGDRGRGAEQEECRRCGQRALAGNGSGTGWDAATMRTVEAGQKMVGAFKSSGCWKTGAATFVYLAAIGSGKFIT